MQLKQKPPPPVVDGLTSKRPAGEASVAGIDVNASVLASANTLNGALKAKRTVRVRSIFFMINILAKY